MNTSHWSESGALLRPELFMGIACSTNAGSVGFNVTEAGRVSGSQFYGQRYGRGEVGEFVLIEGQVNLLLGRVSEVRLGESERRSLKAGIPTKIDSDAIGQIQLLGTIAMDSLVVTAGVSTYPRLGDRIYAAPSWYLAKLPQLLDGISNSEGEVLLELGTVGVAHDSVVSIKPERLFGRHCAILGATGGGKSWTTARLIEECLRFESKTILIDATGEYRGFTGKKVLHRHLGVPVAKGLNSRECRLPPTCFSESDFVALFEPAGRVQGPKLRSAIRSLRLARIRTELAPNGYIEKHNKPKGNIQSAEMDPSIAARLENPVEEFDAQLLITQIEQECVYPNGGPFRNPDYSQWGGPDENSYSYCLSLFARISSVLTSPGFRCVFKKLSEPSLTDEIDGFIRGKENLLRICLSGIEQEFNAREIIANVIGRHLLNSARSGMFKDKPTVTIVDEAHNFLGVRIGSEDYTSKLDAFEIIAKEGRKFGLNICLATQRPRDITEGVLSQMGTLIVHRLTNDRDRELVERACGEIDRSASAFLPNLRSGEAIVIGTDFPIPLTLQIIEPTARPFSDGPDYQSAWCQRNSEAVQSDDEDLLF